MYKKKKDNTEKEKEKMIEDGHNSSQDMDAYSHISLINVGSTLTDFKWLSGFTSQKYEKNQKE